jgi:lipid-binding SYLF domain-containing protein
MLKVHRALRSSLLAAAATLASVLASPTSAANGTVYFEVVKAGFIVGVGRGSGTLVFNGRRYPLSVGGLSFGATIGASKTELIGTAYNLRQASDIAGTYTAVGAGVAVAGGGSSIRLQNARGVVLDLRGRNIGLEISANVSGVEISLR